MKARKVAAARRSVMNEIVCEDLLPYLSYERRQSAAVLTGNLRGFCRWWAKEVQKIRRSTMIGVSAARMAAT